MSIFYSVTDFAKLINVCPQTLRVWDRTNKFKPHHKTPGGHRYYTPEQLDEYFLLSTDSRQHSGAIEKEDDFYDR